MTLLEAVELLSISEQFKKEFDKMDAAANKLSNKINCSDKTGRDKRICIYEKEVINGKFYISQLRSLILKCKDENCKKHIEHSIRDINIRVEDLNNQLKRLKI